MCGEVTEEGAEGMLVLSRAYCLPRFQVSHTRSLSSD